MLGLAVYAAGLTGIVALLPIFDRRRWRWAGPRLLQLLAGVVWWIAMTVTLAVALGRGADETAPLQAMVIGGYAQILVASLAYLGPVLRRGGPERLTAGFAATRSWLSVGAGNVAALGAVIGQPIVIRVGLAVWAVEILERSARLFVVSAAGRRRTAAR